MTDHALLAPDRWKLRFNRDTLTPSQQEAIGEFGFDMYLLESPTVGDIEDIKYGRLVALDDGTRREVDPIYVEDDDLWSPFGKIVILDGVMYRLGGADHADVTEESSQCG